ncbi:universal stress protein [Chloroflexota bacterium]
MLLQVLQVAPTPVVGGGEYSTTAINFASFEKAEEENKKKAIDYLNATGGALKSKGVTVTTRVAIGNASEEIVKVAEEVDANLIAMSTHGRAGLSRWAFGSVTDKVLRMEGRIPITMVKAPKLKEK